MAVIREAEGPIQREPVRPRLRFSRAIIVMAVLALAVLGGYQLWLMAQAVGAAASSAWSAAVPNLGVAWHALGAFFQAIAQAATQVH
jgi:enoyl-CoA hydratase/carnithine racemase